MAISFELDREKRIFGAEFTGTCTLTDLQTYILLFLSHPEWGPDLQPLLDLSGVQEFDLSLADIREIGDMVPRYVKRFGSSRAAIVAPHVRVFGTIRMYQIILADLGHGLNIFHTRRSAIDWLKRRPTGKALSLLDSKPDVSEPHREKETLLQQRPSRMRVRGMETRAS